MEMAGILESLIKERGYSLKAFALKCGIPYTTLYGIIKNGVGKAGVSNIILICKNLGITVEELEAMSGQSVNAEPPAYEQMELLIARNGKKLSAEERIHLINLLSENEDK